jgi:1,4-alpha-glucan branching enzyme
MIKTTRTTKTKMMRPESVEAEAKKAEPAKIEVAKLEPFKASAPKSEQSKLNHISLSFLKPDAKKVCVAGTFNEWKPERTPLKPAGNGRWIGDLTVDPGKYEYLFVVDGQWLPDPNAKESVENPFGGRNSVLVVSA